MRVKKSKIVRDYEEKGWKWLFRQPKRDEDPNQHKIDSKNLHQLSMNDLRAWLATSGEDVDGPKETLIARLTKAAWSLCEVCMKYVWLLAWVRASSASRTNRDPATSTRRPSIPNITIACAASVSKIEILLTIICSLGQSFVHCIFDVGHIATFLVP